MPIFQFKREHLVKFLRQINKKQRTYEQPVVRQLQALNLQRHQDLLEAEAILSLASILIQVYPICTYKTS